MAENIPPFFSFSEVTPQYAGTTVLIWYTRELYWSLLGYQ
jgi:hypothetical protein